MSEFRGVVEVNRVLSRGDMKETRPRRAGENFEREVPKDISGFLELLEVALIGR